MRTIKPGLLVVGSANAEMQAAVHDIASDADYIAQFHGSMAAGYTHLHESVGAVLVVTESAQGHRGVASVLASGVRNMFREVPQLSIEELRRQDELRFGPAVLRRAKLFEPSVAAGRLVVQDFCPYTLAVKEPIAEASAEPLGLGVWLELKHDDIMDREMARRELTRIKNARALGVVVSPVVLQDREVAGRDEVA